MGEGNRDERDGNVETLRPCGFQTRGGVRFGSAKDGAACRDGERGAGLPPGTRHLRRGSILRLNPQGITFAMQDSLTAQSRSEYFRPYFVVDEHMRVQVWPDVTAHALGIPAQEAAGRPCWQLLGDSVDCRGCRRRISPVFASPAVSCARLRASAGDRGWVIWTPPTLISEGPIGSGLIESVLVRGVLVEGLTRCSLEDTLEEIRQACAANDCELFLRDTGQPDVVMRGCVGQDRDAFLECTRMPVGVGYPGRVTATGRPLFTNAFQRDRRFRRNAVKHCGVRSFIGVPLFENGAPIGYLGLGWKDAPIPLDWGMRLLEAVRPIAVAAVRSVESSPFAGAAPPVAEVRCLGAFALVAGGRVFGSIDFPRRKALDLLRHLLLARGAALSRDILIERLWPEVDPRTGANRLHVTLHALRGVLGQAIPGVGGELIKCRHSDYRLDPTALGRVDAFEFADAVEDVRRHIRAGTADGALERLEEVLPLYRGDLFPEAEDMAFEAPRQRFRELNREALRMHSVLRLRAEPAEIRNAAAPGDTAGWSDRGR